MTKTHDETSRSPQLKTTSQGLDAAALVEATQYAYDPQTYEILCRPGQRLSEKKARRLQELGLYEQVVKSAG